MHHGRAVLSVWYRWHADVVRTDMPMIATVDFCGEQYPVTPDSPVVVGREGDIAIDDNPYLHRRFLEFAVQGDLTWLTNVGSQLAATVADRSGLMHAWLASGARLPLVFAEAVVLFTAGPTTYELDIRVESSVFQRILVEPMPNGDTTIGGATFTPDQKLLIVALAEPVLRHAEHGVASIPSSTSAANRLGWTITKFNRKLDNVCQKLTRAGVRGLYVGGDKLATSRRARLVEYAVAARIVTVADLALLERSF
jgi:hypothetical protein